MHKPGLAGSSKLSIKSTHLIFIAALYFGSLLNLSFWRHVYANVNFHGLSDLIFTIGLGPAFIAAHIALISLILWPYVGKAVLIVLMLLSSITSYAMLQFGVHIDVYMVRNVFETSWREATDLISPGFATSFILLGLLPSLLLIRSRITYEPPLKEIKARAVMIAAALAVTALALGLSLDHYKSMRRHQRYVTRLINPTNMFYALTVNLKKKILTSRNLVIIDESPSRLPESEKGRPTVLVMVIGETSRSMSFSLNGYSKQTNPKLAQQDVVSFQEVIASATSTNVAVPSIFSDLGRKQFKVEEAVYRENLLELMQKTGIRILWRENDEGCKGVCDRVPTENMLTMSDPRFCSGGYCLDEFLIYNLEDYLKTVDKDTVLVLHTMGSHGPSYYQRYTDEFKRFQPTCDSSDILNCSPEAVINTYDNTIVYVDHILSKTIDILNKFPEINAAMLYVSDHGESLGEGGIYMHAAPYDIAPKEQLLVPLILWLNENLRQGRGLDYDCLKTSAGSSVISHDNIFHSVLGLMGIQSRTYQPELDIFKPCASGEPRD